MTEQLPSTKGMEAPATSLDSELLASVIKEARARAANLRMPEMTVESMEAASFITHVAGLCITELMARGHGHLIPEEPEQTEGGRALTLQGMEHLRPVHH